MWKNTVELERLQLTIWRISRWVPRVQTPTRNVWILIAFPLQKWLHEHSSMLLYKYTACFVLLKTQQPAVGQASILSRIHDHAQTHHTRQGFSGRGICPSQIPLPDNTQHSRQTSTLSVVFEPTIPTSEQLHTHALGRTATGMFVHSA